MTSFPYAPADRPHAAGSSSAIEWSDVYDSLPDPHVLLAPVRNEDGSIVDFVYRFANAAGCAFHHVPPGGLVGVRLLDLHENAVESGLLAMYARIVETGEPLALDDYAYPQEALGGEIRRYEIRATCWNGLLVLTARDATDRYEAIEGEQRADGRFRLALDSFQEPFLTYAPVRDESGNVIDLIYTYVNAAAERLLGLSPVEVLGARLTELFPSVIETGILAAYVEPFTSGQPSHIEVMEFDDGGVRGSFELSAYPFDREVIVIARDVTQRLEAEGRLAESERRFRLLAQNSMDLVFSLDTRAIIDWVSPSVTSLLGYAPDELAGQFGGILINAGDLPALLDASTIAREGGSSSCRIRMVTKTGQDRWVEATPRPLLDDEGSLIGGVIGVRDIHDEVAAKEALDREVAFDGLTGLAKRSLAVKRIAEILESQTSPGWALLCVGVDGLTAVNQAYTYAGGDAVLVAVAQRLAGIAGAPDRVARIAGDEFVVLMQDIVTPTDAAEAAERILDAVRGPVPMGDSHVDVTACIGIAPYMAQDAEGLLRDGTAAMRQAAQGGPDRWRFLDGEIQATTRSVLSVQSALRTALEEGEIRPWLMPIVRLADGHVSGYEALARWHRPDGTVAGPDVFIAIAERTSLITKLDRVMIDGVVERLNGLPGNQHVSVNVSAQTLASAQLPGWVRDALDTSGIDPSRLHLEVTETSLFHVTDSVLTAMTEIADMGVSWWVDDFGTGYSSVSHLRDLPITGMKLDQSFTSEVTVPRSPNCRIAQGLVGLAHGLDLVTIAEGVETDEQARVLAEQGWQYGQGWLFGRPSQTVGGEGNE